MRSMWLRTSRHAMEIATSIFFIALGGLTFYSAVELGPGWGESGPEPGFFPFVLSVCMVGAAIVVLVLAMTNPDRQPFFEASQEVEDLLKVGAPIAIVVLVLPWLGLYATAGVYLAFFMAWYGKFRWYQALAGGVLLPLALWLTLDKAFNIPMPMSAAYESGLLPF